MKPGLPSYLESLNEPQRRAVTRTEGPMLILAGAGSGKTRTITSKIAYLIGERVCDSSRILAVTFTNKAAAEMADRVGSLIGGSGPTPLICTFHSFCVRLLRLDADRLGFGRDFTICDAEDQRRVLKSVCEEKGLPANRLEIGRLQSILSASKNRGKGPEDLRRKALTPDAEQTARVLDAYQRYLRRANAFDFDDLLLFAVRLLQSAPDLLSRYQETYRYLLIDEYQDTNQPQYELVRLLGAVHGNVTAVGDEDQSIYAFRGANVENILRFEKDFPGARVIKLEENYRSTQSILDAAMAVVAHNERRLAKSLWTRRGKGEALDLFAAFDAHAEATRVAHTVFQLLQQGRRRMAVLYRTNFQSRQFEEALRRLNIPYRLVGGTSFYSRKEIKDAVAYLRVVRNPGDSVSLLRILNEPPRGIGAVTVARLEELAVGLEGTVWQAVNRALDEVLFSGRVHAALERFRTIVSDCRAYLSMDLPTCLEKILERSGYMAALENEDTEEALNRKMNLEELLNVAREHADSGLGIQEFLDHAALRSDTDDYDEAAPVTLMTLHNAKGLEFPIVFLVGLEEGTFPHSRSSSAEDLEEERRLCYVGMTRAQEKLYLSYSRTSRFFRKPGLERTEPSRFLNEIPQDLLTVHDEHPRAPSFDRTERRRKAKPFPGRTFDTPESVRRFLGETRKEVSVSARGGIVAGAWVRHREFGEGRVLDVQEVGRDLKVTVKFTGSGIRKLYQSYARMEPI